MRGLSCKILTGCVAILWSLSAAHATEDEPPEPGLNDSKPQCRNVETGAVHDVTEARSGTEMVGLYPCWSASENNTSYRDFADYYTHWSIRLIRADPSIPRDYKRESKSPILRVFIGRDTSIVSSLKIDIDDPKASFVIPLTSFTYQGRAGKGQSWSTNLVSDDQTQPFFRIGPTSSARISLSAQSSTAMDIQVAGTVLTALQEISAIASPGPLVTAVNRDSLRLTSQALDKALSSIWSDAKDETEVSARQISEWYPKSSFLIEITAPNFVKDSSSDKNARLTRWYELTLSCPRQSIFSSAVTCRRTENAGKDLAAKAAMLTNLSSRISTQQVNGFKLGAGKTLQQFLSENDWYTRFLRGGDIPSGTASTGAPTTTTRSGDELQSVETALTTNDGNTPPPAPATQPPKSVGTHTKSQQSQRSDADYAALCHSIINALYGAGLSKLDSQIGLWAVVTGSGDFVGIESVFQNNPQCHQLLPLAGTAAAWNFSS